jgi:P27 family predicted phage terminase small subunit
LKKPPISIAKGAPATLSRPARDQWRRYVHEYLITDAHGLFLLEQAMLAYDRVLEAQAAVKRDGMTTPGRDGQPRSHPALVVERDARAQMLMALKHLNLDLEPVKPIGRPPGR